MDPLGQNSFAKTSGIITGDAPFLRAIQPAVGPKSLQMLTRYSFFLVSKVANIAITDAVMGTEIIHYLSVLSFYVAYAIQSVNMLNFSFKNSKFTPFYSFLSLFYLPVILHPRLPYRPLSRGGHFVSGDLKSFVYARQASFSLRGYPCINKAF